MEQVPGHYDYIDPPVPLDELRMADERSRQATDQGAGESLAYDRYQPWHSAEMASGFWAKLTPVDGEAYQSSGQYSFIEVGTTPDGLTTITREEMGRFGVHDSREWNGRTDVPEDTIVWMWHAAWRDFSASGCSYVFSLPLPHTSGGTVEWDNTTFNITGSTFNYITSTLNLDTNSIVNLASPAINITDDTTFAISAAKTLTLDGPGSMTFSIPATSIDDNATFTIANTKTLTIAGAGSGAFAVSAPATFTGFVNLDKAQVNDYIVFVPYDGSGLDTPSTEWQVYQSNAVASPLRWHKSGATMMYLDDTGKLDLAFGPYSVGGTQGDSGTIGAGATASGGIITDNGTGTLVADGGTLSIGFTFPNTGLHILDTNASHDLIIAYGSDVAADKTLTIVMPDSQSLTISGSATVSQDYSATGTPSFAGVTLGNAGLHLLDTNASHDLILSPGSDLAADRTLTLTTGDADRTLTISGNATVSQDYSTAGSPQFTGIELSHATANTLTGSGGDAFIEGNLLYRAGGTDVPLADGGTGASLADPGADRVLFWDDSAGGVTWLTMGTGLAITDATLDASGLSITGLTAVEAALDDYAAIADTSDSNANKKVAVNRVLGLLRVSPGGRLTGVSGSPVADAANIQTLYYTPYFHDIIVLWDGTRWLPIQFAETSIALGAMTAGRGYDVFGYLSGGVLALEKLVWTSATARATAVTYQDGRLCKSGDKTRLLLGAFYSDSTTETMDRGSERFLSNLYNQEPRPFSCYDTTASWTHNAASWRRWRNQAANMVELFTCTGLEMAHAALNGMVGSSAATDHFIGIGIDSDTPTDAAGRTHYMTTRAGEFTVGVATYDSTVGLGYHDMRLCEYGAASGTNTFYGFSSGTYCHGLTGHIMG
jgi:hypothetical protein